MKRFDFDTVTYPFREKLTELYDINDLKLIHKDWSLSRNYDLLDNVKTDQNTLYHKHFYENIGDDFYEVYNSFIKNVIMPCFDESVLYQAIPTFRVHQPNNIAVAEFHRDRDYSHSTHEVNVFLPLTTASGNATIWVESGDDVIPMEAEYGQFWLWDGANLKHGNKLNDTGLSRVSIDFRVLPKSKYQPTDKTSTSKNMKMIVGSYWNDSI